MAAVAVVTPLAAYLAAEAERPFDWRTHNCGQFVCGWIAAQRGIDPGAALWGRFTTAMGCARMLKSEGFADLADVAHALLGSAGLTELPKEADLGAGDVALVSVATKGRRIAQALALASPPFLVLLGQRGLVFTRAPVLAAWRL